MPEYDLDMLDPSTYLNSYTATGTAVMLTNSLKLLPKV